jgi:hypothetical protein
LFEFKNHIQPEITKQGIQLEPLPVEPRRGKKGRGKKRKGPIIDKETQIPLVCL